MYDYTLINIQNYLKNSTKYLVIKISYVLVTQKPCAQMPLHKVFEVDNIPRLPARRKFDQKGITNTIMFKHISIKMTAHNSFLVDIKTL